MKLLSKKRIALGALGIFLGLGIYAVVPALEPMPDESRLRVNFPETPDGAGTLRLLAHEEKIAAETDFKPVRVADIVDDVFSGNAAPEPPLTPEETDILAYIEKQRDADVYRNAPADFQFENLSRISIDDLQIALESSYIPWDEVAAQKILNMKHNRELCAIFDEETDFYENPERQAKNPLTESGKLISTFMAIIRLERLRIRAELERGNVPAALARYCKLHDIFCARSKNASAMIEVLANSPSLEIIHHANEDFFSAKAPLDDATIATLKRKLAESEAAAPDPYDLIKQEFFFGLAVVNHFANTTHLKTDLLDPDSPSVEIGWFGKFQLNGLKKIYLKSVSELLPDVEARLPLDEMSVKWAKIQKKSQAWTFRKIVNVYAPLYAFWEQQWTPPTHAAMLANHAMRTFVNANSRAKIRFAFLEYRREHGEYPQSLDALVPAYLERVPEFLETPRYGVSFNFETGETKNTEKGAKRDVPYEYDPETRVVYPKNADCLGALDDFDEPASYGAFRLR